MKESNALKMFRFLWTGRTVEYKDRKGVVVGVCDDGVQAEFDRRRRMKPTGELIVRQEGCERDSYWPADRVKIQPNA